MKFMKIKKFIDFYILFTLNYFYFIVIVDHLTFHLADLVS
jgi:hypothetical protein